MAGSPLKRRVAEALRARATQHLGDDADLLMYAVEWIAAGKSIQQLADDLSGELGTPVSRPLVSGVLNGAAPDAPERLETARRESAYALVEEATRIADDCAPTAGGAAKARLQAGVRQWTAEKFNAAAFGQKGGALVQVSIGSLMLDALRQAIVPATDVTSSAVLPVTTDAAAEYEIVQTATP